MAAKLTFKIVTPERVVFEQDVFQATLPVEGGEVTVLSDHVPYIGALQPGEIMLREHSTESPEIGIATSGGFAEFHGNTLTILADTAERAEEIDLERAEAARERAEAIKKERASMDAEEYARVAAALEKELARIRVARRHRSVRTGLAPRSDE